MSIAQLAIADSQRTDECTALPAPPSLAQLSFEVNFLKSISGETRVVQHLRQSSRPEARAQADVYIAETGARILQQKKLIAIMEGNQADYFNLAESTKGKEPGRAIDQLELFYVAYLHDYPIYDVEATYRSAVEHIEKYRAKGPQVLAFAALRMLSDEEQETLSKDYSNEWLEVLVRANEAKRGSHILPVEEAAFLGKSLQKELLSLVAENKACQSNIGPIAGQVARTILEVLLDLAETNQTNGEPLLSFGEAYSLLKETAPKMMAAVDPISYPQLAGQLYSSYARYNYYLASIFVAGGGGGRYEKYTSIADRSKLLSVEVLL